MIMMATDISQIIAFLDYLNQNRVLTGVAMILMNIGSRFVASDLTQLQESMLASKVVKRIILFCMFFVGTRDILISIILTFAFTVFLQVLINEGSKYNLLPASWTQPNAGKQLHVSKVTEAEYKHALYMVRMYERNLLDTKKKDVASSDQLRERSKQSTPDWMTQFMYMH